VIKNHGEATVSLKTTTGRFVQSLLFLPPAIMLFRSFWLYDVTSLSAMVVALTLFAALRYVSQRVKPVGTVSGLLHFASAAVALLAASLSVNTVSGVGGGVYEAVVFCIVLGGLMFDVERRVQNEKMARLFSICTSVVLVIFILVHQQLHDSIIVFAGGLFLAIALTGIGVVQKHKEKMLIGAIAALSVLLLNASGLFNFFMQTGWLGFASLGVVAIIIASLLERFGAMFSLKAQRWLMSD